MTTTDTITPRLAASSWMSIESMRAAMVSLIFISSFLSKFEPSPTDYFLVLAIVLCIGGGLRFTTAIMPLLLLLLIYNLSGLVSYLVVPYDIYESHIFVIGLALTSSSAVLVAVYLTEDPVNRYQQIQKAYWIGATTGSIIGLLAYFEVEPFLSLFSEYGGRVIGGYKDPNVFSTWLVFPLISMLQAFLIGSLRLRPLAIASFSLIFAALILAFSRGAWINAMLAAVLTITFTFLLSPSNALRGRISLSAILGIAGLAAILMILLTIPAVREVFLDRFTLVKEYDAGETGRFGNQLKSIPMLMDRPLGFGPYQFAYYFNMAPHNTFLNSFASCGWVGGIAYVVLTVSNMVIGFRAVFVRTPFQPYAIAAYSCLITLTFQGVQIDTEHWRHFYWIMGITWGLFAASLAYVNRPASLTQIAESWNLKVRPRAG